MKFLSPPTSFKGNFSDLAIEERQVVFSPISVPNYLHRQQDQFIRPIDEQDIILEHVGRIHEQQAACGTTESLIAYTFVRFHSGILEGNMIEFCVSTYKDSDISR